MHYLAYVILGVVLLGLICLAAPISVGCDSTEKWYRVKWLGLSLTRRWGPEKPKKIPKISKKKKRGRGSAVAAQLWQRDLAWTLISQLGRFVVEVWRTLSFRDSEAAISLPDPMWNGVLYAALAPIHRQEINLSVNFENRNYAKLWVTVYPYRVAQKLAVLLIRLPYRQLLRLAWDLRKSS
jgi:hypothetical protein